MCCVACATIVIAMVRASRSVNDVFVDVLQLRGSQHNAMLHGAVLEIPTGASATAVGQGFVSSTFYAHGYRTHALELQLYDSAVRGLYHNFLPDIVGVVADVVSSAGEWLHRYNAYRSMQCGDNLKSLDDQHTRLGGEWPACQAYCEYVQHSQAHHM